MECSSLGGAAPFGGVTGSFVIVVIRFVASALARHFSATLAVLDGVLPFAASAPGFVFFD
jgi:hypothetical protein